MIYFKSFPFYLIMTVYPPDSYVSSLGHFELFGVIHLKSNPLILFMTISPLFSLDCSLHYIWMLLFWGLCSNQINLLVHFESKWLLSCSFWRHSTMRIRHLNMIKSDRQVFQAFEDASLMVLPLTVSTKIGGNLFSKILMLFFTWHFKLISLIKWISI